MSTSTIGIKTGDGLFFPVLEESFKGKKRFVLTTVNDNQTSVQIDFYRSINNQIEGAEYIGSLVIENIEPAPRKVPEIEVIVGVDPENSLHAVARNLSSEDDKQSLTVSLESLGSGLTYDIPEFELDEKLQPTSLFESDQDLTNNDLTEETYPQKKEDNSEKQLKKGKANPLMIVLFVLGGLILIAIVAFGIYLLVNLLTKPGKPPIDVNNAPTGVNKEQVAAAAATAIIATATPAATVQKTTIKPTQKAQPVIVKNADEKKKAAKGGGYWYTIKRGDTLWDIAERTYGNPWSYYNIYKSNKKLIKDPDLIFSGFKIYLPKL